MTRDGLIEKVARSIFETWAVANEAGGTWDELLQMQNKDGYITAKDLYNLALEESAAAIGTVHRALKEPTEAMSVSGCKADDPLGELVDWKGGSCTTREAVKNVWQAMLAASPIAPEGEKE